MDILHELGRTTPQGPFGALRSGDASEAVCHFSEYGRLHPEDQATVNRVWSGHLKKCLVLSVDGHSLFFIEYAPSEQERAGIRYGYIVRAIAASNNRPGSTIPDRPRTVIRVLRVLLAVLCIAATAIGGGVLGREFAPRRPEAQPVWPVVTAAPIPAVSAAADSEELRKRLLDVERRERELVARERRTKYEEGTEVARLRAIIEAEAEASQARASLLRTKLAGMTQGQDQGKLIDEKPVSGMKPKSVRPAGDN